MNRVTNERLINTDVLVIGGGMAGFFAAIKAKEQGLDVTLTDKAYVARQKTPLLPIDQRVNNFKEVKRRFNADEVALEALRCMTCGSRAVIKYPDDCQLCLFCERDCPQKAIYVSPERKVLPMIAWV